MVEEDTQGPGWHLPTWLRGLVSPPTFLALTPSLGSGPQALAWASSRNRPSGNFTHSADTDQPDSQEPKDPASSIARGPEESGDLEPAQPEHVAPSQPAPPWALHTTPYCSAQAPSSAANALWSRSSTRTSTLGM